MTWEWGVTRSGLPRGGLVGHGEDCSFQAEQREPLEGCEPGQHPLQVSERSFQLLDRDKAVGCWRKTSGSGRGEGSSGQEASRGQWSENQQNSFILLTPHYLQGWAPSILAHPSVASVLKWPPAGLLDLPEKKRLTRNFPGLAPVWTTW